MSYPYLENSEIVEFKPSIEDQMEGKYNVYCLISEANKPINQHDKDKGFNAIIRGFLLKNSEIVWVNEGPFNGLPNCDLGKDFVDHIIKKREFKQPILISGDRILPSQLIDPDPIRCSKYGSIEVGLLGSLKIEEPYELFENGTVFRPLYKMAPYEIAFLMEKNCVKINNYDYYSEFENECNKHIRLERTQKLEMQGKSIALIYHRMEKELQATFKSCELATSV
jgi:hypothetical protein